MALCERASDKSGIDMRGAGTRHSGTATARTSHRTGVQAHSVLLAPHRCWPASTVCVHWQPQWRPGVPTLALMVFGRTLQRLFSVQTPRSEHSERAAGSQAPPQGLACTPPQRALTELTPTPSPSALSLRLWGPRIGRPWACHQPASSAAAGWRRQQRRQCTRQQRRRQQHQRRRISRLARLSL